MWFDAATMKLSQRLFNAFSATHVSLYRMTGGRIGGRFRGAPILLLTHLGRKSGRLRTTPLMYGKDGDSLVVVASNGGARNHPAWFHNILDDPEVEVDVGKHTSVRHVRVAEGDERERLWRMMNEIYGEYDAYQERAKEHRQIPVVVLQREPGLED